MRFIRGLISLKSFLSLIMVLTFSTPVVGENVSDCPSYKAKYHPQSSRESEYYHYEMVIDELKGSDRLSVIKINVYGKDFSLLDSIPLIYSCSGGSVPACKYTFTAKLENPIYYDIQGLDAGLMPTRVVSDRRAEMIILPNLESKFYYTDWKIVDQYSLQPSKMDRRTLSPPPVWRFDSCLK